MFFCLKKKRTSKEKEERAISGFHNPAVFFDWSRNVISHEVCQRMQQPDESKSNWTGWRGTDECWDLLGELGVAQGMDKRALTARFAIISLRVGEKTGRLTSSGIKTVMLKLPHWRYFRVMRSHGAESEGWAARWPFSPTEINLSPLTALGILQPVATSKSIPRLFVFSSYHPKWQIVAALFSRSLSDGLIALLPALLWGKTSAGCLCLCDGQTPHLNHFNHQSSLVSVSEASACVCWSLSECV